MIGPMITLPSSTQLRIDDLLLEIEEAEETLRAIRAGAVDALVVRDDDGPAVRTFREFSSPYKVLVEAMNEGAALLTAGGVITYANPGLGTLLGRATGSLIDCWSSLACEVLPWRATPAAVLAWATSAGEAGPV